jgi:biotin carboxylase
VVTEQTDVAVPTVALVAQRLGLPGIGVDVARAATNKYEMRRRCREQGLPTPEFFLCRCPEEAKRAARDIGLPVIVKPVDNQASRGVTKAPSFDLIEAAFLEAARHSRSGEVLVEEQMIGTESSVEAFVEGEAITTLGICDKQKCAPPYSYDTRLTYPGRFDANILEELRRANESVIRALGIRMGITHGEYIVTKRGVRVIEIAARGCGARVATELLPAMTGADVLGARLRQALGQPPNLNLTRRLCGVLDFIVLPPGSARRVEGIDEARSLPGVVAVDVSVKVGQAWDVVTSGDQRHGLILTVGETVDSALAVAAAARGRLQLEVQA